MSSSGPWKYGEKQENGSLLQNAINDPSMPVARLNESKPVLTIQELESRGYTLVYSGMTLDDEYKPPLKEAGCGSENLRHFGISAPRTSGTALVFQGYIGTGYLILEDIKRGPGHPYISDLARAVYQESFDINSLACIFVHDVLNMDTVKFAGPTLYGKEPTPYIHVPEEEEYVMKTWKYDSDEYHALLGTEVGKVIAYLVLEAFPRGTQRIIQIVTWIRMSTLNMRFDVEKATGNR